VAIWDESGEMHEMLCSRFESEFDNRMLQVKKQLGDAESFFPLLYSKFISDEFYGHLQTRTPQPPATKRAAQ
jgi:hypothetical protein